MQQTLDQTRDWVQRIAQGDRLAEAELVECFYAGVHLILLKRTGSVSLANDLCQDTFMVVLRKLQAGELLKAGSLPAFIRQTAVNLAIQHFRKEKRFVFSADEIIGQQVALKEQQDKKIDQPTIRKLLSDALDELAVPRDREVLYRYYLGEEEKEAICKDLGLSPTHFDRVLYRARLRIRELIDQQDDLKKLLLSGVDDDE